MIIGLIFKLPLYNDTSNDLILSQEVSNKTDYEYARSTTTGK